MLREVRGISPSTFRSFPRTFAHLSSGPKWFLLAIKWRGDMFRKGRRKSWILLTISRNAVEALLIYLYTLEYPIRKPHKFREPWTNGCAPAPVLPASSSTAIEVYKKPAGLCAKMGATDYARSKLKSVAPEESWQEHAGIYCIAKRLDLASLAATSLKLIIRHLDTALRTGNVKEFIRGLYNIYNNKIQGVKDEVAKNMADQEFCVISEFELNDAIICCPVFGCDLANAMRKRDKRQTEMIAELRRPSDKQKKRRRLIDDLSGDSPSSVSNP
jgi:uncharacterized protein YqeY